MVPIVSHVAEARSFSRHHHHSIFHAGYFVRYSHRARFHYARHPTLQCVAFVREETGVQLDGNARNWWGEADGLYARGNAPEQGSVLSFRGSRRMRLGHVAVVSKVVGSREIEIDQAHWASRGISRGVSVIDVSPDNDWTAVRVALREDGKYGSTYATNGFIYDRAPGARIQTASATIAPARVQNAGAATADPKIQNASAAMADPKVQNASASTADPKVQSASVATQVQNTSAATQPEPRFQNVVAMEPVDSAADDPPLHRLRWHGRHHWHRSVAHRGAHNQFAYLPVRHGLDLELHQTGATVGSP